MTEANRAQRLELLRQTCKQTIAYVPYLSSLMFYHWDALVPLLTSYAFEVKNQSMMLSHHQRQSRPLVIALQNNPFDHSKHNIWALSNLLPQWLMFG